MMKQTSLPSDALPIDALRPDFESHDPSIPLIISKRPSRDVHRQIGLKRVIDLNKLGSNH